MTAQAIEEMTAREYVRQSADKSGHLVSSDQQSQAHAEIATEQGWRLGVPYVEAGAVSASRYGRKVRAGFADLITDLETGAFGADVLLMWEASRGSRRAWEWARLIEALKDAGVRVYVASEERLYDPANARDRKSLRDSASDSEYESDKISGRVGRAMTAEAKAGNPHGREVYGYRRVYRIDDGGELAEHEYRLSSDKTKIGRQEPEPREADAVRLVYRSLMAGESLRSIGAALSGEGARPAMGAALRIEAEAMAGTGAPGEWPATRVRDVALNPAYAGKRLHVKGGRLASARADYSLSDLQDGNWPALVSFADWLAVTGKLRANKRHSADPGRQPKHLLSMIATCATCGGPLAVRFTHRGGVARYSCQRGGHVTVNRDELDAIVSAAVQRRLATDDAYPAMAKGGEDAALSAARDELATVKGEHSDLIAMVAEGKLSAVFAAKAEPGILARIKAAEARVRDLASPSALSSLGLAPGHDIFARWTAAPLAAKRQAIRALFDKIEVRPAGRGYAGPVADRIGMTWR